MERQEPLARVVNEPDERCSKELVTVVRVFGRLPSAAAPASAARNGRTSSRSPKIGLLPGVQPRTPSKDPFRKLVQLWAVRTLGGFKSVEAVYRRR